MCHREMKWNEWLICWSRFKNSKGKNEMITKKFVQIFSQKKEFPWICSKQMQLFPLLYLPPRNLPFVCSLNTHRRLFIDSRSSFKHGMGSKREINASGHKGRLERQIYAWNVHASTGSDASKYADSSIRTLRVSVHGS